MDKKIINSEAKEINFKNFGQRLSYFRLKLMYSQIEFANFLDENISQNCISKYEVGKAEIPFRILEKLCRIGINLNWFIAGEGDMFCKTKSNLQNGENLKKYNKSKENLKKIKFKLSSAGTNFSQIAKQFNRSRQYINQVMNGSIKNIEMADFIAEKISQKREEVFGY